MTSLFSDFHFTVYTFVRLLQHHMIILIRYLIVKWVPSFYLIFCEEKTSEILSV
jgi:hypothetical protein